MNAYLSVNLKIGEIEKTFRFYGCGPYTIGFSENCDISLLPYFANTASKPKNVLNFTQTGDEIIISSEHETTKINLKSNNYYNISSLGIELTFESITSNNPIDSFETKIHISENLLKELENKKAEQQKILFYLQTQIENNNDQLQNEERRVIQLQNEKNELELNLKKIDFDIKSRNAKLETLEDGFKKLSEKENLIKNEINRNKTILEESKNSIDSFNTKILDYNNILYTLQKEINDKKQVIELLIEEQMLLNTKIKNGEEQRQSGLL